MLIEGQQMTIEEYFALLDPEDLVRNDPLGIILRCDICLDLILGEQLRDAFQKTLLPSIGQN